MAKKIGNRKQTQAQQTPEQNSELDILHPEREIMIQGKKITIREYGGIEWLRLLTFAQPLIDAFETLIQSNEPPTYEEALLILSEHDTLLMPLVAQAADLEPEQLEAFSADDMELLLLAWWGTNGRFFIRRAANRVAMKREMSRLVQWVGENSTPPLSPTDTPCETSGTTPIGK